MITSKSNEIIKTCLNIKSKKYSRQLGQALVESIKLVRELANRNMVDTILVVEGKEDLVKNLPCDKVMIISSAIAEYLSETITTDGVFAIANIPHDGKVDYSKCLILDHIQDPSNMGAIIRSACAFGYNTILSLESVYPYTAKCIRSSMGQVFNVNFLDISIDELIKLKDAYNLNIIAADMDGVSIDKIDKEKLGAYAIVIGNEGNGVCEEIENMADTIISIPMENSVESLNASVSAGILMYLLK